MRITKTSPAGLTSQLLVVSIHDSRVAKSKPQSSARWDYNANAGDAGGRGNSTHVLKDPGHL